jgi:DNA-binding MarR family transcriptional regulator
MKDVNSHSALHLLHRAGQCADDLFARNIGKSDLTPRQFAVLRAVSKTEDLSQTALVAATGIDRSTLADIVRRLVERGLLQRKRTREDARMYAVRITATGRSAMNAAQPAASLTEERVLGALPASQRNDFLKSLNRIVETLATVEAANGSAAPAKASRSAR